MGDGQAEGAEGGGEAVGGGGGEEAEWRRRLFPGAGEGEWEDWEWQAAHRVRTAEEVSAMVRPLDLLVRRRVVPVLEMRGGAAQVPIGGAEGGRQAMVNVGDVLLRLTFQEGEVVVQTVEGRTEGIRFAARGAVYLGGEEEDDDEPLERPLEMALQMLESLPESAAEAVETWQKIRFAEPPLI